MDKDKTLKELYVQCRFQRTKVCCGYDDDCENCVIMHSIKCIEVDNEV